MHIPIAKPFIGKKEIQAAVRVLTSGHITEGPCVEAFEQQFASYCGTKYAIAVNSGTAALHASLYALGIKAGDEIITTPFTFVATANAIQMIGAIPIFVDIDENTFLIDTKKIQNKITKNTKAILAVDLFGQSADYKEIYAIAHKYKLFVIEDAAQSIGGTYKKKKCGNIADIAAFSLYATKNIMCGEGGVITTNNEKFACRSREFRNHGQSKTNRYHYNDIGYNYRLTDLSASIAIEQMKRANWITKKRQQNASMYSNAFASIKGLITPKIANDRTHVFHQYTIRITSEFPMTRNALQEYLQKKGITANIYYPVPLYQCTHLVPQGYNPDEYPITEVSVKQVLSLPVYPQLTQKEISYIIKAIQSI